MNDDEWEKKTDADWDPEPPWERNGSDSVADAELLGVLLDWEEFWKADHGQEEWMAWPVIPMHRQTSIFAKAGSFKSLVMLDIAAAIATGKPILGQPNPYGPRHGLYLDYEMTPADLQERLEEMGYGPDDDWSHFHYAQLPPLEPLDTPAGATQIRTLAALVKAELVIIDTLSRAVQGDENDADTIRDFYRLTGSVLKADGRTVVRLDHAGKDASKGQRGTSAKNDDVDLVWEITVTDDGITLTRGKSRIGWADATIVVTRQRDPLRHEVGGRGYVAGTADCIRDLEGLGVPVTASTRVAQLALKEAGKAHRRKVVVDACRSRCGDARLGVLINQHARVVPKTPEPASYPQGGNHDGNQHETYPVTSGNHLRNHQEPPDLSSGSRFLLPREEPVPDQAAEGDSPKYDSLFDEDDT